MPTYRIWITTHIERPLYVDAEDARTAEAAAWEYVSDAAAFWPALPMPWEYAETEDYIDADDSRRTGYMNPVDIRAVVTESGDVSYSRPRETASPD